MGYSCYRASRCFLAHCCPANLHQMRLCVSAGGCKHPHCSSSTCRYHPIMFSESPQKHTKIQKYQNFTALKSMYCVSVLLLGLPPQWFLCSRSVTEAWFNLLAAADVSAAWTTGSIDVVSDLLAAALWDFVIFWTDWLSCLKWRIWVVLDIMDYYSNWIGLFSPPLKLDSTTNSPVSPLQRSPTPLFAFGLLIRVLKWFSFTRGQAYVIYYHALI